MRSAMEEFKNKETQLLYFTDSLLVVCQSLVRDVYEENGKQVVILDQTAFYPQGGGQPCDKGKIIASNGVVFIVEDVRNIEGIVKHIGKFENGVFEKNMSVECFVDKERRFLHSRIHSAGHVLDMGLRKLDLQLTSGRGYHFPEGPYNQYFIDKEIDKEKLLVDLERACNECIQENHIVKLFVVEKKDLAKYCHMVPENIPDYKKTRVVMFGDSFGLPCGGTHVSTLSEIGPMKIKKIKIENNNSIKISYLV